MTILTELAEVPLLTAATALLGLFAAVAAIDGIWLHLWRYRLHARAASYGEHVLHTASAVLFPPIVIGLFRGDAGPLALGVAIAALIATHVVEVLDVRTERRSREALGGLTRGELAVHVAAVVTRTAAVGLTAASLAFEGAAPRPLLISLAIDGVLWGAVVVAVVHVALAVLHCPVCSVAARSPGAAGA